MSENQKSTPNTLSCAEFQEHLPDLFALSSNPISENAELNAHLKSCENCSALVRDLQYIAEQARMLFEPAHDIEPSDDVWSNIQSKMGSEPAFPERDPGKPEGGYPFAK